MSAQECPTCGAKPGFSCRSQNGAWWVRTHISRLTLEYGDWVKVYDEKYRDKTLRFQCRPYAA